VAAALLANLTGAFRVHHVSALTEAEIQAIYPKPLYLPKSYTPYRFEMGATFPIPDLPRDNPLIVERVNLGRTLFYEKQLSRNDRQSCADCHQVTSALGDHKPVAVGAEGQTGTRNAMPLFNLAWKKSFFWDGRAASLREQALQPIQNPLEMHDPDQCRREAGGC
jgi:cytochrome c peroxidase